MIEVMVAPSSLAEEVARILTREKEARGLSFTQLAFMSGLGRATVVRYLTGARSPKVGGLDSLCAALGLDVADVLDEAQAALRHRE